MSALSSVQSIQQSAYDCLMQSNVAKKLDLTFQTRKMWESNQLSIDCKHPVTEQCIVGIPENPKLVPVQQLPKRSVSSNIGHAALIHSFAHIEFNAINIAWDAVYRFPEMPKGYYEDWSNIAAEEAYHFQLLQNYLLKLGYDYGSFPAHSGLWDMVEQTSNDVMVRMALVPRVLEARGLDVTPEIIQRFRQNDRDDAASILEIIYQDEIGHVGVGTKWFVTICEQRGLDPHEIFADLINEYAADKIRQPFNEKARKQAGFTQSEMDFLTNFT